MTRLLAGLATDAPFSWNPLDDVAELVRYEFMRNALAAGTAAAVCAGVVGYLVVLRRLPFAAHALTQMGFAGATGALAVGAPPVAGLLLMNGAGAGVIGLLGRRARDRDVTVAVVQGAALGLGLLFLSIAGTQAAVPVLTGDIYGVDGTAVLVTALTSLVVLVAVAAAWRPLLLSSLDDEVAAARGVPVVLLSAVVLAAVAATVAVATAVVGVLMAFALVVGPAAAAAELTARPGRAVLAAVGFGVAETWLALTVAYWVDLPPSVFLTTLAVAAYLVAAAVARRGRVRR